MTLTQRKTFGDLLRDHRKARRYQLGTMAGMLGVAPSYLSDVELGRRPPFSAEKIKHCAKVLELDDEALDRLLVEASRHRGAIELHIDVRSPAAVELGAALMREWPSMTPEDQHDLNAFMRQLRSKKR